MPEIQHEGEGPIGLCSEFQVSLDYRMKEVGRGLLLQALSMLFIPETLECQPVPGNYWVSGNMKGMSMCDECVLASLSLKWSDLKKEKPRLGWSWVVEACLDFTGLWSQLCSPKDQQNKVNTDLTFTNLYCICLAYSSWMCILLTFNKCLPFIGWVLVNWTTLLHLIYIWTLRGKYPWFKVNEINI